jgi:hypothetical protein
VFPILFPIPGGIPWKIVKVGYQNRERCQRTKPRKQFTLNQNQKVVSRKPSGVPLALSSPNPTGVRVNQRRHFGQTIDFVPD